MKKFIFTLILVLMTVSMAYSQPPKTVFTDTLEYNTTKTIHMEYDTFYAITQMTDNQKIQFLILLSAVDYKQTVDSVIKQPDKYYEANPVIGKHPTRGNLLAFGLSGIAGVYFLQKQEFLNKTLSRIIVDSVIASETMNIWENEYTNYQDKINSHVPIIIMISLSF